MQLLERIDEARERWNVLRHPFYVRWERGELCARSSRSTRASTGTRCRARRARPRAPVTRATRARSASTSRSGTTSRPPLDAPAVREPLPQTRECVEAWSPEDELEALAVLSAVEAAQPAISETKLRGLVDHYGFEPGTPGTRYFELHAERDVEHAREARAWLAERAAPEDEDRLGRGRGDRAPGELDLARRGLVRFRRLRNISARFRLKGHLGAAVTLL